MSGPVIILLGALVAAPGSEGDHLLTGELVKVNLLRRSVTVKTEEKDPREIEVAIGEDTSVVSRGRVLRLEDLRTGEPVKVLCRDIGRAHRARVLKMGASRYAVAGPSPSPSPGP